MDENLNLVTETTGAEEPAVAEPVVEAGAEVQEVAEPVKSTSDAAFAEMRRAREAAEAALKAKESENARLMEGLGLFFERDDDTNGLIYSVFYNLIHIIDFSINGRLSQRVRAEVSTKP